MYLGAVGLQQVGARVYMQLDIACLCIKPADSRERCVPAVSLSLPVQPTKLTSVRCLCLLQQSGVVPKGLAAPAGGSLCMTGLACADHLQCVLTFSSSETSYTVPKMETQQS